MSYPYAGSKNAGQHLLLEGGMKFTSLGARPDLLQALDSRRFGVIEIARVLNIPPPFLMDLSHATCPPRARGRGRPLWRVLRDGNGHVKGRARELSRSRAVVLRSKR